MGTIEVVELVIRLLSSIGTALVDAFKRGDVATVEALRGVLQDPEALKEFDRLLVATQRAKAERELGSSAP